MHRLYGFAPLGMGLILFSTFSKHPSVAALNAVETSALVLSGALFVIGVAFFFGRIKPPQK